MATRPQLPEVVDAWRWSLKANDLIDTYLSRSRALLANRLRRRLKALFLEPVCVDLDYQYNGTTLSSLPCFSRANQLQDDNPEPEALKAIATALEKMVTTKATAMETAATPRPMAYLETATLVLMCIWFITGTWFLALGELKKDLVNEQDQRLMNLQAAPDKTLD
ncbi:uncharacterized protein JN550_001565 [Neoarthrinium moseri]|uniref:uncharacterized protein n=1 Tax=Neoarthrinium moseri TaxID=1658444 RepID=UPI001FDBF4FD|nr:uncharacterized protein JN550_001565 [Neoarthrinium moseri]KAI1876069.1 hypothetical protein JN550_001565 [Neoarthrinium moseri]